MIMVSIFSFSMQTADESAELSGGFSVKLFSFLIPGFKDLSPAEQTEYISGFFVSIRKVAHFSLYFAMGIFSFCAFITYKKIKAVIRILSAFILCGLYAISDEIHQYFVPGRACELRDVLIDCSGALLSIGLLTLFCYLFKKIRKSVF